MITTSSKKLKNMASVLKELSESYVETLNAVEDTSRQVSCSKDLWKRDGQSKLIKYGLTLIALPDPLVVTDVTGLCMVSVGLLKKKIKNSSLHVDDIYETLRSVVKDVSKMKHTIDDSQL